MKRKELIIVVLLNLFIAIGFFIENKGAGFTEFSSDLFNSIPICNKLDNPALFQHDLFLDKVSNVRYYTPFYIQTVRFFARCAGGDYVAGINILATLIHLIYGIAWFLLFSKLFRNFAVALFLSILVRGVVWLPGSEMWGISDIWTMMPRTLYAAFMPIPFLLLLYRTRKTFLVSCLLIGFIFNFHPITGMGGLLMFALLIASYPLLFNGELNWGIISGGLLLIVVGMLPFLSTYFVETNTTAVYDLELYKKAFSARIPNFFSDPAEFLGQWIAPKILLFAIPLAGYAAYAYFVDRKHLKKAILLVLLSLLTIAIFSVSVYVENAVNGLLGINLRMSFQMIRAQKLAILPGFVALGYLLCIAAERIRNFGKVLAIGLPVFIVALFFAKLPPFNGIPFFSDDIARSIFPDYRRMALSDEEKQLPLDRMLDYIRKNTSPSDVFYGKFVVRTACSRSVVLDEKGASMLIEGNPVGLIKWYTETQYFNRLSPLDKIEYLRSAKHVTYILTEDRLSGPLKLVKTEGNNYLYKIL